MERERDGGSAASAALSRLLNGKAGVSANMALALGAGVDIVCVVLLYLYVLPADVKRGGPGHWVRGGDQEEAEKANRGVPRFGGS